MTIRSCVPIGSLVWGPGALCDRSGAQGSVAAATAYQGTQCRRGSSGLPGELPSLPRRHGFYHINKRLRRLRLFLKPRDARTCPETFEMSPVQGLLSSR